MARCLCLERGDAYTLAYQLVHQGGLAHIGVAHDVYESCLMHFLSVFFDLNFLGSYNVIFLVSSIINAVRSSAFLLIRRVYGNMPSESNRNTIGTKTEYHRDQDGHRRAKANYFMPASHYDDISICKYTEKLLHYKFLSP